MQARVKIKLSGWYVMVIYRNGLTACDNLFNMLKIPVLTMDLPVDGYQEIWS